MKKDTNILEELSALNADTLQGIDKRNFYTLPVEYFNNLASNIISRIKVESIPVANLYSVPVNYFETLPGIILDKIYIGSVINSFSNKQIFSVPENYFDNLSVNILQKVKNQNNNVHQELEEISPLLNSIPKTNVYSAPDGYFKSLSPNIPIKINQPAKVVSFTTKTRRWVNYAAAACLAAVLFSGGYLYMNKLSNSSVQITNVNVQQQLAKLSDAEINNYLVNDKSDIYTQTDDSKQNIDVQSLLNTTSDEEIENYLMNNSEPNEPKQGI